MFKGKTTLLFSICISYMGYIQPGPIRIDTLKTTDNKKITFLADNHNLNAQEQEKIDGIMGWLQENEKTANPVHVLVEQPSWICDIFGCNSEILFHLPKRIQQKYPNNALITYENLDIRHVANIAHEMLTFLVPHQFNFYKDHKITKGKTLGALTFQDMLDEFVHTQQSLSDYYLQHNNPIMRTIYNQYITRAGDRYKHLLKTIDDHKICRKIRIMKYAKKNSRTEKTPLANGILNTFSPLVDLHTIRQLLTLPYKNMVVAAGSLHAHEMRSALYMLNAFSLYSAGKDICQGNQTLISIAQIQQGLSAQKQSLMKMYTPIIMKNTIIAILSYLLYATIIQVMVQRV